MVLQESSSIIFSKELETSPKLFKYNLERYRWIGVAIVKEGMNR